MRRIHMLFFFLISDRRFALLSVFCVSACQYVFIPVPCSESFSWKGSELRGLLQLTAGSFGIPSRHSTAGIDLFWVKEGVHVMDVHELIDYILHQFFLYI